MIIILQVLLLSAFTLFNSSGSNVSNGRMTEICRISPESPTAIKRHFQGAFSNGMKGDSISFEISADGQKLENLTFSGYWRCSGKLERIVVGPDGAFKVSNNKVNDHITEPPNGGSTAWRFELETVITGKAADGIFRMNINNLGCDTYKLKFTAREVAKK